MVRANLVKLVVTWLRSPKGSPEFPHHRMQRRIPSRQLKAFFFLLFDDFLGTDGSIAPDVG
jgi:hypothetical protein